MTDEAPDPVAIGPLNPVDLNVGRRLKERRKELNLSQKALAVQVGVTFQQLQKYESGINRVAASRLYELAEVLDVSLLYFFDGLETGVLPEGKALQQVLWRSWSETDLAGRRRIVQAAHLVTAG